MTPNPVTAVRLWRADRRGWVRQLSSPKRIALAERAVADCRRFSARQSLRLVTALTVLARCHLRTDEWAQAEAAAQEAIDLCAADPGPENALALNERARALIGLNRPLEALADAERAVTMLRPYVPGHPGLPSRLADTLYELSRYQATLGRDDEALPTIEEAVKIYADLPMSRQIRPGMRISYAYVYLAAQRRRVGRHEEAIQAGREALSMLNLLALANPAVVRPWRATVLVTMAYCQEELGRHRDARATAKQLMRDVELLGNESGYAWAQDLLARQPAGQRGVLDNK